MSNKVKTARKERAEVKSYANVDGLAQVTWEPIHWCGMKVNLITLHEITCEDDEPDVNYSILEWKQSGEVLSVDICLDNDELHNAFNGHYDYSINDYIKRLTDCRVTNDTEFST